MTQALQNGFFIVRRYTSVLHKLYQDRFEGSLRPTVLVGAAAFPQNVEVAAAVLQIS